MALVVNKILTERVNREGVNFNYEYFPHIPKSSLSQVGKALPKMNIDIIVGNQNLSLRMGSYGIIWRKESY